MLFFVHQESLLCGEIAFIVYWHLTIEEMCILIDNNFDLPRLLQLFLHVSSSERMTLDATTESDIVVHLFVFFKLVQMSRRVEALETCHQVLRLLFFYGWVLLSVPDQPLHTVPFRFLQQIKSLRTDDIIKVRVVSFFLSQWQRTFILTALSLLRL